MADNFRGLTTGATLGRELPFSQEAEEAVLGGVLRDPSVLPKVIEILKPESFYRPQHQQLFTIIVRMFTTGSKEDLITVINEAVTMGVFETSAMAKNYLLGIMEMVPSTDNIESYCKIIEEKARVRSLINAANQILEKAYDGGEDSQTQLDAAEQSIFEIRQGRDVQGLTRISDVIVDTFEHLQEISGPDAGEHLGAKTGFGQLDAITTGLNRTDLIIIAARPAMGKTAFVLSMAKNIAVDYRNPVALFSLEMSNVQLVNRLIANVCEIPSEKIKSGQLANYEWQQLDYKLKNLMDAPLYVDDTPSLSVFELRTKARRLVREHGVRIIIIDYLQLMNASGMAFGSRQEEVSTISRSLKGLAKELNIPIIALSQLNRGVESREGIDGKRPQLSDLRESGAIEQDADMVCFIHRPEYYKIYQDDRGNDLRGMAEIVIAKHRNGAVGEVLLRFKGEFTRFSNPEDDMVIPMPGEPAGAMLGSKMNTGNAGSVPPPAPDFAPQTANPFGAPGDGPLPF